MLADAPSAAHKRPPWEWPVFVAHRDDVGVGGGCGAVGVGTHARVG